MIQLITTESGEKHEEHIIYGTSCSKQKVTQLLQVLWRSRPSLAVTSGKYAELNVA